MDFWNPRRNRYFLVCRGQHFLFRPPRTLQLFLLWNRYVSGSVAIIFHAGQAACILVVKCGAGVWKWIWGRSHTSCRSVFADVLDSVYPVPDNDNDLIVNSIDDSICFNQSKKCPKLFFVYVTVPARYRSHPTYQNILRDLMTWKKKTCNKNVWKPYIKGLETNFLFYSIYNYKQQFWYCIYILMLSQLI